MRKKRNVSDDPIHRDLVSGLRGLGYRVSEAREAADHAMRDTGRSLEERMRTALAFFRPESIPPSCGPLPAGS